MREHAEKAGYEVEIVGEAAEGYYLARLTLRP
jgi:hypothetical protein